MKQLAYFIIGLGIGFFACKFLFQTEETKGDTQEATQVITKPEGVISPSRAKELDKNFNERHSLISNAIGKQDNRSSWYSLTDIENYLAYAKQQTGELGYTMDGIRIYVGSHGEKDFTTMFIVPTGNEKIQKGSLLPANILLLAGSSDIDDGDGLNDGGIGEPPSANYPQ